ncbi:hypothetical protein GE061_018001 [Apolygus lucorum]|uniref:Uncharacterized protein n=1 Tax=Apolygus lucorum TaxID=248454 RepID=A0A8S9XGL5_APOLU|nr:hypothetical protein GE061_018001 [Apolygus lucorum]
MTLLKLVCFLRRFLTQHDYCKEELNAPKLPTNCDAHGEILYKTLRQLAQSDWSVSRRRIMRLTVILFGVILLCHRGQSSFFDSMPIVSQLKSLVQVIGGDADGARRTQENFLNTAAVVSQIKSAIHAAQGEKYAKNLEELANSLPVVGHVKGGVHIALGDEEKGVTIIKGATSSTGAVIGGIVAGPAGAVLGGTATDALITGIDSAVHQEFKPHGIVDYAANFDNKDVGEHFDVLAGIGLDVAGGAVAKKPSTRGNNKAGSLDGANLPDAPRRLEIPDEHKFGSDARRRVDNEEPTYRFNNEETVVNMYDDSHLDISVLRKSVNLDEYYQQRLEATDFREVNDVMRTDNCYLCTAAGMKDMTVTQLMERYNINSESISGVLSIDEILSLYKKIGWEKVGAFQVGNAAKFQNFLKNYLIPGGKPRTFALGLISKSRKHVAMIRAWNDVNLNSVRFLIVDYQLPLTHPQRFLTSFPLDFDQYIVFCNSFFCSMKSRK